MANDSGIYSQAGFVFQMRYFILRAIDLATDESIEYEAIDDVSISKNAEDDENLGILHGPNAPFLLLQVKKADVDKECGFRIIYNWLLGLKECSSIDEFTIVQEIGRNFCPEPFSMSDDDFAAHVREAKGNRSLISHVRDLYDDEDLKKAYRSIVDKYAHVQVGDIDEAIKKKLIKHFHLGGVSQIIFNKRVNEFICVLECRIIECMQSKMPYRLSFTDLMAIYEDIISSISESIYKPSFGHWKYSHPIDTEDAGIWRTREVCQLRHCFRPEEADRLFKHLHFLSYYSDIRYTLLEVARHEHVSSLEGVTYENYESAKEELAEVGIDAPAKRLRETKKLENSFTSCEYERWGSCIFLTKDGTDENQLISWKDEDDSGLIN